MTWHPSTAYPKRKPYYVVSLGRSLLESGDTAKIGDKAALLVLLIAFKEDQFRYRGWVNFWNGQLMDSLGFSSRDKFNEARKRAVDAGWLLYERDNDRQVGYYMLYGYAHFDNALNASSMLNTGFWFCRLGWVTGLIR